MRILYLSHYFPPEMGAPAARVAGLTRLWARAGHDVHVLTGFPHHPTGQIHPDYRRAFRRGFCREDYHGVEVHRTWIYPAANRGKVRRSFNYLSFMLSAALTGAALPRPDVIVATSPQLLCAVAGYLLARRFRAPLVMEVRDLWPESLVAVGASEHRSSLVKGLEALARWLYRRASHVVTVTEAQREAILASGIASGQVSVIPNGVDAEFLEAADRLCGHNAMRSARPGADFVVTYIGTLGMAHGLGTLLEAAARLRREPRLRFCLVGEGANRRVLEARVRELGLTNVEFAGEQPRGEVPRWIAGSDLCLVLLRRTRVFRTVVPSKMLEIMAVGRPIVLGVEGAARELLERAGAGIAIEPENAAQLVAAIRALERDPAWRHRLGENGREFVRREFLRATLAARYLDLLANLVHARAAAPALEACGDADPLSEPR